MYIATIDSGTTNSRVYIVDETGKVVSKAVEEVGVKNTAITGSRETLKNGIAKCFQQALDNINIGLEEVELVLTSGMITSEIGLIEIPHLVAPVKIDNLASEIVRVQDTNVFPIDIPVHFIRGIKNAYDENNVKVSQVGLLDFMRGEEAQVAGLLTHVKPPLPTTMVMLSSHTKFIPITEDGTILGSLTTMSGQTYAAIKKETFVGKSIAPVDGAKKTDFFDPEIIDNATYWCEKTGFIRALMMPRFLDTLLHTEWYERDLFVEGLIAAEDMKSLNIFEELGYPAKNNYILIGASRRCKIYSHILKKRFGDSIDVQSIDVVEDIDNLSIQGVINLAKKAGLINN